MKKVLLTFITCLMLLSCGRLRNETIRIKFLDGSVDTVQLRYRGKLIINPQGNTLVDNLNNLGIKDVKSYSILK